MSKFSNYYYAILGRYVGFLNLIILSEKELSLSVESS